MTRRIKRKLITQKHHTHHHTHEYKNTSSGWKQRCDTRTVHIGNAATVRQLSDQMGIELDPTRFRPNIVMDGLEPWSEIKWIGTTIEIGRGMQSPVLASTVRCQGVSIDPEDDETFTTITTNGLDISGLLVQQFPEHGP